MIDLLTLIKLSEVLTEFHFYVSMLNNDNCSVTTFLKQIMTKEKEKKTFNNFPRFKWIVVNFIRKMMILA